MKKIRLTGIDSGGVECKAICIRDTPWTPVHKNTYRLNHFDDISRDASIYKISSNCDAVTPVQVRFNNTVEQHGTLASTQIGNETSVLFYHNTTSIAKE